MVLLSVGTALRPSNIGSRRRASGTAEPSRNPKRSGGLQVCPCARGEGCRTVGAWRGSDRGTGGAAGQLRHVGGSGAERSGAGRPVGRWRSAGGSRQRVGDEHSARAGTAREREHEAGRCVVRGRPRTAERPTWGKHSHAVAISRAEKARPAAGGPLDPGGSRPRVQTSSLSYSYLTGIRPVRHPMRPSSSSAFPTGSSGRSPLPSLDPLVERYLRGARRRRPALAGDLRGHRRAAGGCRRPTTSASHRRHSEHLLGLPPRPAPTR